MTQPITQTLANIAEGTHENALTLKATAAITTRYLLVALNQSDRTKVEVPTAADTMPIGIAMDEPEAEGDPVSVQLLMSNQTRRLVTSEALHQGQALYAAANGKVSKEPNTAGTYWFVGYAISESSGDGDVIEAMTCMPGKLKVLANGSDAAAVVAALDTPCAIKVATI